MAAMEVDNECPYEFQEPGDLYILYSYYGIGIWPRRPQGLGMIIHGVSVYVSSSSDRKILYVLLDKRNEGEGSPYVRAWPTTMPIFVVPKTWNAIRSLIDEFHERLLAGLIDNSMLTDREHVAELED